MLASRGVVRTPYARPRVARWPLRGEPRPWGPDRGWLRRHRLISFTHPIFRVDLANFTGDSGTVTSSSVSVTPTGQVEDDLLVAFVVSVGGSNTISGPDADWTEITPQVSQGTTTVGSLWQLRGRPSEAGPYVWTGASARRWIVIVAAYRSQVPGEVVVVDDSQFSGEGALSQQLDHNSLTPSTDHRWHIIGTCSNSAAPDDDAVDFSTPDDYARLALVTSEHATSANARGALVDRELQTADATGVRTVSITGGVNRQLVGMEVILTTAAGAPPVTGSGLAEQRSTVIATTAKVGAGIDLVPQRSETRAITAKVGAGTGVTQQRSAVTSTGGKVGAGVGVVEQRSTVVASRPTTVIGAATTEQRSTVVASGAKVAAGTALVTQRGVTQAVSQKVAVAVALVQQRTVTLTTVLKRGVGTGLVPQRSATVAPGQKSTSGIARVQQRSESSSSSLPGGSAVIQQRSAVVASGGKVGVGIGRVVQRSTSAETQRKIGVGVGSVAQRSTTREVSGSSLRAGAARVDQRAATTGAAAGLRSGSATVVQHVETRSSASKLAAGGSVVVQRSQTLSAPLEGLTTLRIRTSGREPSRTLAGREPAGVLAGREDADR